MNKALVIVDYQTDFVTGALGFDTAADLDSKICEKAKEAVSEGWDIIFTLDTHGEDYLNTMEGKWLPVSHCIKDSEGWGPFGKTADYLSRAVRVFEKNTFGSLELADYLRSRRYDEVELCGLVSYICVLSNAVLAKSALPEAKIIVDASCTGAADKTLQDKALDIMTAIHINVIR